MLGKLRRQLRTAWRRIRYRDAETYLNYMRIRQGCQRAAEREERWYGDHEGFLERGRQANERWVRDLELFDRKRFRQATQRAAADARSTAPNSHSMSRVDWPARRSCGQAWSSDQASTS